MNCPDHYLLALSSEKHYFTNTALAGFIKIIFINADEDDELITEDEKFDVSSLMTISHLILGTVTWSIEGNAAFRKFTKKLPIHVAHHISLAEHKILDQQSTCLAVWIQEQLRNLATKYADEVVKLQRSLIATRQEHERTQVAFSSLENHMLHHSPAASQITFSADQTAYYYPEDFTAKPLSVSQILPIPSQGFSGIEVFFSVPQRQVAGHIAVSVITLESEKVLGEWTVNFSRLRDGWNLFSLAEAPNSPSESLAVKISWHPATEGLMPSMALSWHQPLSEFRLKVSSDETPPLRSLAFRCVSYLPGLRVPTMLDAFYPNVPQRKKLIRAKYKNTFQSTTLVSNHGSNSAQLVQSLDGGSRLLVHPTQEGITVALLSVECPENVTRVSASVKTEHQNADDICYSIALVSKNTDVSKIMKTLETPQALTAFSGWHVVPPGIQASVHLMTKALDEAQHILLMTKLPPGSTTANAWATFQEMEFFSEATETL